jgi:hypothetical protein
VHFFASVHDGMAQPQPTVTAKPKWFRTTIIVVAVVVAAVVAAAVVTGVLVPHSKKKAPSKHRNTGSSGSSNPLGSSGSSNSFEPPLPAPTGVQVTAQPGGLLVTAALPPVGFANLAAVATAVTTAEAGVVCGAAPPAGVAPAAQVYMSPTADGLGLTATVPTSQPACVWVQLQGGSSVLGPFTGSGVSVAPGSGPSPGPSPLPTSVTLTAIMPMSAGGPAVLTVSTNPQQFDSDWWVTWYSNGEQIAQGQLADPSLSKQEVAANPAVATAYYVAVFSGSAGNKSSAQVVSNTVSLGPPVTTLPTAVTLIAQTQQPAPFTTRITPVLTGGSNTQYLNAVWFQDGVQQFNSSLSMTPFFPVPADGKSHLYGLVLTVPGTTLPTSQAQLQYP